MDSVHLSEGEGGNDYTSFDPSNRVLHQLQVLCQKYNNSSSSEQPLRISETDLWALSHADTTHLLEKFVMTTNALTVLQADLACRKSDLSLCMETYQEETQRDEIKEKSTDGEVRGESDRQSEEDTIYENTTAPALEDRMKGGLEEIKKLEGDEKILLSYRDLINVCFVMKKPCCPESGNSVNSSESRNLVNESPSVFGCCSSSSVFQIFCALLLVLILLSLFCFLGFYVWCNKSHL